MTNFFYGLYLYGKCNDFDNLSIDSLGAFHVAQHRSEELKYVFTPEYFQS
jgi:hypothetical protein